MIKLDHIVINVLFEMESASALFSALGFTLTPVGHHTLGSINRLMVAKGHYLELIGIPDKGLQRREVLDSPFGLNGLVFKSDAIEATHAGLVASGFAPPPPLSFSRPVKVGSTEIDARFRTVRLPAELTPAGRVYFCQHLTPELVWRDEWLRHANGFCGIDGMIVESPYPFQDAKIYAEPGGTITRAGQADPKVQYDSFQIMFLKGERYRFRSVTLLFDALDEVESRAKSLPSVTWERTGAGSAILSAPTLSLMIECRRRHEDRL
jgi:hypothetical protein